MRLMSLAGAIGIWAITAMASERGKSVYDDLLGDPAGRRANPPGSDLNIVTPDIRDEVILYLRRYASGTDAFSGNKTGLSHNSSAQLILIRLGDEQTIAEFLKERDEVESKYGGMTATMENPEMESAQPLLIPGLAPKFFRQDGDAVSVLRDDDLSWLLYPVSAAASLSALGIMKESPVFNASLREWAGAMYESVTNEDARRRTHRDFPPAPNAVLVELRKSMREWWKENARNFEAKDYASVKPGAWLPAANAAATAESAKDTADSPVSKAEIPHPVGTVGEPVPPASYSSTLIYPVAIGSSLLLLASIAFFLRRRKSG